MQRTIMYVCAQYHCAKEHYQEIWDSELSTEYFVSQEFSRACSALINSRISLNDFLFLAKVYGVFLTCYGHPLTEAEKVRFHYDSVPDPDMRLALICVARAGDFAEAESEKSKS